MLVIMPYASLCKWSEQPQQQQQLLASVKGGVGGLGQEPQFAPGIFCSAKQAGDSPAAQWAAMMGRQAVGKLPPEGCCINLAKAHILQPKCRRLHLLSIRQT